MFLSFAGLNIFFKIWRTETENFLYKQRTEIEQFRAGKKKPIEQQAAGPSDKMTVNFEGLIKVLWR